LKALAWCALVALALACIPACHKGQVRLQRAPGVDSYIWRNPLSPAQCRSHWQGLLFVVTAPVGYPAGREQEVEGFVLNAQLRWNDAVRPLGGLFMVLCEQHNQALITFSEFEQRRSRLINAAGVLSGYRSRLEAALQDYREARKLETVWRGAEGAQAATRMGQARQQMAAAAQNIEMLIQKAEGLIEDLKGPRAEARLIAGE